MDITISGQPTTAAAGDDQSLCNLTPPYYIPLSANTPVTGHGTGTWSIISKPALDAGAFSNVHNPSATYGPAVGGLYIFDWTITDGTCSSSDQVRVNLYNPPSTSDAGSDQTVCGTQATMAANLPVYGIGAWTMVSGPGTAIFTSLILPNTTVNVSVEGTYVFRWTITNGVDCTPSTSTVTIYFHACLLYTSDAADE